MGRERDESIEERIQMEIVVDAHDEDEQTMGWFYFPCIRLKPSPFRRTDLSPILYNDVTQGNCLGSSLH